MFVFCNVPKKAENGKLVGEEADWLSPSLLPSRIAFIGNNQGRAILPTLSATPVSPELDATPQILNASPVFVNSVHANIKNNIYQQYPSLIQEDNLKRVH